MALCLVAGQGYGQVDSDQTQPKQYYSLGGKRFGIGLGNPPKYSGLLFQYTNMHEGGRVKKQYTGIVNGIRITGFSEARKMNGFTFGLAGSLDSSGNGLSIGLLAAGGKGFNGLAIGGAGSAVKSGLSIGSAYAQARNGVALGMFTSIHNGLTISLGSFIDTINGVVINAMYSMGDDGLDRARFTRKEKRVRGMQQYEGFMHMNGVAIAGIAVAAAKIKGAAIAPVVVTEELNGISVGAFNHMYRGRGIQIGLLNYMGNNRRWCRWLPIVNAHFRKTKPALPPETL